VERSEWMDEIRARDTLYGPLTRSGQVEVVQTPPETVWACDNVVRPELFHVVEPWMNWDSISWERPVTDFSRRVH
jgi:hypothetical protein